MIRYAKVTENNAAAALVAEQLTAIRVRLGYDLERAARDADIDPQRLAEAEAGESVLNESELDRLAAAYGVDVTAFFGGRVTPFSYLAGG